MRIVLLVDVLRTNSIDDMAIELFEAAPCRVARHHFPCSRIGAEDLLGDSMQELD